MHFESLYYGIIDSLKRVKAPTESSRSYGLQHSYLKTSLAWSSAEIDSTGKLYHNISNHDSIDTKIIYKYRDKTVFDSIYIYKTDTLRINKNIHTIAGLTKWDNFFILLGKITSGVIIAFFIGIVIYKLKIKNKT